MLVNAPACWLQLGRFGVEEIPSCFVHLFRVGLRSCFFFLKQSHNFKMETADSKGILSVCLSVERAWPASDRGASSLECARGQ